MSAAWASQAAAATYAFGWRDGLEPLRISWGETPASGTAMRVDFCSFAGKSWPGFPQAAALCLPAPMEISDIEAGAPLALGAGQDLPTWDQWSSYCGEIESALANGTVKKVVPARSRLYPGTPPLASLLHRLFSRPAEGSYRFFLKWQGQAFFGATPELLFRKIGEEVLVPAIAGTRTIEPAGLAAATAELFASVKERAEHQMVVDGILSSLKTIGLAATADPEPRPLVARNLVHLFTPVRAGHGGLAGAALVEALHPTPAVGGLPRSAALSLLTREPWERGLFASPLLISLGAQELCLVGIRSALWSHEGLRLFAGAGYVKGSTAEAEWEETGRKMESLKGLLE